VDLIRGTWLECANESANLVGDERVRGRWEAPSCLPQMTVGDVAGHLFHSGVFLVEEALTKASASARPAVSASRLLSGAPLDADDAKHDGVRIVAASQSAKGHDDLVARMHSSITRIEPLLVHRDDDSIISFPWGAGAVPMTLRELLRSRVVELAVHFDDLAVSAGIDDLTVSPTTVILACEVGVAIDVERYGATEVLRALFRRERGSLDALRTF